MYRPGEDKGYDNPLIPFVGAIIMWMWAAVIYLSDDREIPLLNGKLLTDSLRWAFGHIIAAIFFVFLGFFSVWVGIKMRKKEKEPDDSGD